MLKKFLTFIMLIFVIIGLGSGVYFASKGKSSNLNNISYEKLLDMSKSNSIEVTEFFTFGRSFNISGIIPNVYKDNFESVKLYLSDGNDFEKMYNLNFSFDNDNLVFTSRNAIINGLNLDDLEVGNYIVFVRLKLNNSVKPKFYSLKNSSEYPNIEYYTVTSDDKNNKVEISFKDVMYDKLKKEYLAIDISDVELPEDVYDIVLDAGHGGSDVGERYGSDTEADISLDYVNNLKIKLEEKGFKVKLTRDESNTDSFTYDNMYDDNGRISIACKTKAKIMLSFHINNGNKGLKGLEIYSPCGSDISLPKSMADKIIANTNIEYSNNNSFKVCDGVYVRNFTKNIIDEYSNTANKKGYEPYNITLDTPYLYTIREVGGIATNAYVDGRNASYSANKYYRSNQGLECYQIEMGYLKNDLQMIKSQIDEYTMAISDAISENL